MIHLDTSFLIRGLVRDTGGPLATANAGDFRRFAVLGLKILEA